MKQFVILSTQNHYYNCVCVSHHSNTLYQFVILSTQNHYYNCVCVSHHSNTLYQFGRKTDPCISLIGSYNYFLFLVEKYRYRPTTCAIFTHNALSGGPEILQDTSISLSARTHLYPKKDCSLGSCI